MRIRKEPDLRGKSPAHIAAYLAERWQGRAICANDLQRIYGMTRERIDLVIEEMRALGAFENVQHHSMANRENQTSYRIKAHG